MNTRECSDEEKDGSESIRFFEVKYEKPNPRLGACDPGTLNRFDFVLYKSNQIEAWSGVPENRLFLPCQCPLPLDTPMPVSDDPLDEVLRPPPNETPEQYQLRLSGEAEAKRVSMAIDANIKAERQARRKKRIVRLLLLGQSESGECDSSSAALSVEQIAG